MPKAGFFTLGCKLNFSETSTIGKQFLEHGYDIVDFKEKADVYVINTCTVTQFADRDCRQVVRRAQRTNPDAYIIVTGCYAQLKPEEITRIEGVDAVVGSNEKFKLFDLIGNFEKQELSCTFVTPTDKLTDFYSSYSTDADARTRAFLKVQDGCDYKCSFCTIPLARGKSRSAQPEEVLENFNRLLDEGYKEIILTGVNVGDYGRYINTDLYSLLLKMLDTNRDFRLRISSIEPNLLEDRIIELTANDERMCNHFHIPLQSGNTDMLRAMQRRYKAEYYAELVHKIKSKIPDAGIGVDVIVGFPGETEEEFRKTYDFINKLPVSYLHVFTYSERPDTKAILMDGVVPVGERRERNNMLRILSAKKRSHFYNENLGKSAEVLFEADNHDGMMKGFASNYIRVAIPYDNNLVNKIKKVKITSSDGELCYAENLTVENNNIAV